jgi:5-methylcytosine-specific restriction protein A
MPKISAQDRSDPETAREVIESVFEHTPGAAEQSYIEFLAASIEFLSKRHPDRWGNTLSGWGVRLNVGWVESLVLYPDGLNVLVEAESAPAGTKLRGFRYDRAPGCDMTTVSLAELPESLTPLAESHFAALSIAATGHPPRAIRNAHSPGLTAFLSQVLRRQMRDPSYYAPSAKPPLLLQFDEETADEPHSEGGRVTVLVNRFERDSRAREKCVSHYGLHCSVCNMSFRERYGEAMKAFIHVHHLVPLADVGTEYQVDPISDLRPVCPNCHAVIHHGDPPLSIEQARALLKR